MDVQIALAPDLKISPAEFVDGWNELPDARNVAQARVKGGGAKSYLDPLTIAVLTVAGSVAVNLASSALYDLIREALAKKGVRKHTRIIESTLPDGTRVVVVDIAEG